MGMFDDLIPKQTPDKPQGMFDDLIQQGQPPVQGVSFDDLIPKTADGKPANGTPPVAAQTPQPSAIKQYWDGANKKFTDITGTIDKSLESFHDDFKKGTGDKSWKDLLKTESLPAHLVQGAKRIMGKDDAPKPPADKTDPGMLADLKALGVTAKDHPGIVIGSLVKSLKADPELLLPWLWEAIPEATALKVAQAAKAMGASVNIAKAAEAGAMVTGRAAMGGAVGAGVEGADQFSTGQYDAGKVGQAAAEGAIFSTPGRLTSKKASALRDAGVAIPRQDEAVAAGVAEPIQGVLPLEDAKRVADVPQQRLTAMDMTRESLAQAVSTDPITTELIKDVAKEPIKSPTASRDRMIKTFKQAALGGAVGATAGYIAADSDEHSEKIGMEAGAMLGIGIPLLKYAKYTGADISPLVNARNGQVKVVAKAVYDFQHQIEKAVPELTARENVTAMLDHGVEPEAGTPEHEVHQSVKAINAVLGDLGVQHGVWDSVRENYITHLVEEDPTSKSLIQQFLGGGESSGSPNRGGSSFGRERKHETLEDLHAALEGSGLRIKTRDVSEIVGIYANAVYKAIADKQLLAGLKETKFHDGSTMIVPVESKDPLSGKMRRAPRDYVRSTSPQLAGVSIHPDISRDLEFVFSHSNPNNVGRKLQQLTSITKRIAISTSMFHATTLIHAFMGAEDMSLRGWANRGTLGITAARKALKMYKEGGNNEVTNRLLKQGMQIGTPEDVAGQEIQHGLDKFADVLDKRWPLKYTAGLAVKGLSKIDKTIESFTFGTLQTGFKLHVGHSEYERLIGKGIDPDRAAKLAASLVNDLFGSLDYYRVATDTDSHVMRMLGTGALNTNARKVLQLALFAPDWTMATFRSLAKAMPGGTSDEVLGQMHRRYAIKAALYYLATGNGLNIALSGHTIFDNKDPTRIDYGDGRTMLFSKHDVEPLEWLRHPVDTGFNKLGFIPGTIWRVGKEHIKASMFKKPAPTPVEDIGTAVGGIQSISIQQFVQNGIGKEAAFGFFGSPVYGTTDAQKAEKKEQAAEKRREKRAENEPQN